MNDDYRIYGQLAQETKALGNDVRRTLRAWYGQAVALLMHALDSARRMQVRLVVRLAPPDVADAVALQARLFPEPAKDAAEKSLRDSLCSLLAAQANAANGGPAIKTEDWSTLASVMRYLADYDRDWPMRLIAPTLNRRVPRPVAPAAPTVEPAAMPMGLVGAQGFLGAAVNPFSALTGYLSMGLAVIVVLLGMWSWGLSAQNDKLKAEQKQARQAQRELLADNVQLREALRETDARVGEANQSAMENARRASEVINREVQRKQQETAMRRREEARRAADRQNNPDGIITDPDAWLRELAVQPLLSASPVAAPDSAGGAGGGDPAELPGTPRPTP